MGRRLRRVLGFGFLAVLAGVAIPVAGIELGCRGSAGEGPGARDRGPLPDVDEPGYARPQSSTYFTFPEWYIVYVAEDFATYTAERNESGFGYGSAISGFWSSFCTLKRRTRGWAEPTGDVSTMIYVIGLSFTAEYAIKGFYETTIGRLTEWIRGSAPTGEDVLAHRVAGDYARFLYTVPWYKYPFAQRLKETWTGVPSTGSSVIRSAERKVSLTLEYGVKAGYGWLIQKALDASGDEEARDIMMLVRGLSPEDLAAEPRLAVLRRLADDVTLVRVPRYQVFTDIAVALSRKGRVVAEVAGNRRILMTVLLKEDEALPGSRAAPMIAMPLDAKPGWIRAGFDVGLAELTEIVPNLDRAGRTVEHLFDY